MDSLQLYMNSVKEFGRINKDEEKSLARIIFYSRNPDRVKKAKEKMANSNLLLVVDRALRFSRMYNLRGSDVMDLISEGNIGLVRAVELFRENKGAGFATFAIYHIDNKISRFVKLNKLLHIPEHFLRLRKKMDELESEGKINDKIIREELDISQDVVDILRDDGNRPMLFLEDVFSDEDGINWADAIKDESAPSPYKENCTKSLRIFLDKYLGLLTERESQIVKCVHYSQKDMSLDDISKVVHVSRERVRQIYATSLRKLRIYMIKGFYSDKEIEQDKNLHYGRRGSWRYTHKTMEELEMCAKKIMDNLSLL